MRENPASPNETAPAPKPVPERQQGPETERPAPKKAKRKSRPLRLLLFFAACLVALFGGMAVGYVYIGKQPLADIWKLETWKHLFDLIFAP